VGIFLDRGVENSYAAFNQVYDNDGGGIYVKTGKNIDIYYNLIYDNSVSQGDGIRLNQGASNVNIFNNTIKGTKNGNGVQIMNNNDSIVLKNNIISNSKAYGIYSDGTSANISEDYNQLYRNTSGHRQKISAGDNSQYGNPRFANAASDNFTLKSKSPAINAGELQFIHAAGWHDNPNCKAGYTVKDELYGDPDIGACESNIR
jgi:parallel beta-helix repeat protein